MLVTAGLVSGILVLTVIPYIGVHVLQSKGLTVYNINRL